MEVSYNFMAASAFTPRAEVAWLPDYLIVHFFHETPSQVKQGIEEGFFDGRSVNDMPDGSPEVCDALVINALIGLQKDMKTQTDENDWYGMIDAYEMPQEYETCFRILAELSDREEGLMTESEFNEAMGADEIN